MTESKGSVRYSFESRGDINQTLLVELLSLDKREMDFSWTKKDWESYILKQKFLLILNFRENSLNGFVLGRYSYDFDFFDLDKVIVKKQSRKCGVGSKLLSLLEADLKSKAEENGHNSTNLLLEVSSSNTVATDFYINQGFKLLNRVKCYYSNGCDALKMQKKIIL